MILTTLVAAVALGILAQVLAERFQVAAILPLLVFGILFGPAGLALFDPHALGNVFEVLIHLGVAVILFEGGLSLDPGRLVQVGRPVVLLLTVGVAITGVGSAALAHNVAGMPWSVAVLFGAIMTVTGPTVIVPLLRHMVAPTQVKTVLLSEGLIIDPIGAVLAYLVLQWVRQPDVPWKVLSSEMLSLVATGAILGFVAGAMAKVVVRSRVVAGELRNLSILALLMVCYLVAERQAPQSGILASVVMGFTMSAAELPDLVSVKAFKGQLTTLVISMLFILLSGQLKIATIAEIGGAGALVVAGMIFVVRPLAVFVSIWPRSLPWRERLVLAMIAPRGIVAAAVASLAAVRMTELGQPGGTAMEGLVYLAILVTGAWSTLMAVVLPRLLGFLDDPTRRRAVLVGAHRLTEELARRLAASGRTTVVVDSVPWRLRSIRDSGIATVCGDARDAITYEEAGVERDSVVVADTTNDELNLLVAELVHTEFGVENPTVALQSLPEGLGRRSRAWIDLLSGGAIATQQWVRRLEQGKAELVEIDCQAEEALAVMREVEQEHPDEVRRLMTRADDELRFAVDDATLEASDGIVLVVSRGRSFERLAPIAAAARAQQEKANQEVEPANLQTE